MKTNQKKRKMEVSLDVVVFISIVMALIFALSYTDGGTENSTDYVTDEWNSGIVNSEKQNNLNIGSDYITGAVTLTLPVIEENITGNQTLENITLPINKSVEEEMPTEETLPEEVIPTELEPEP